MVSITHHHPSSSTTYITCPADPKKTLGIKLPFLVMIIKNLKKYFTFEVQVSTINVTLCHAQAPLVQCTDYGNAHSLTVSPFGHSAGVG